MSDSLSSILEFEDVMFEAAKSLQKTPPIDPEKSTVLYDEMTALVKDQALNRRRDLIRFIATYIDKNSESLTISGPYIGIYFDEKRDAEPVFQMIGVTKKEITTIIKKCPLIQSSFQTLNNPFFSLLTALICVYGMYPKDPLCVEAKMLCEMYMTIRFYSSRQKHLWKFDAQKPIMDYTINNLSNKFLFKIEGSVYNVLKHLADGNDETVGTKLRETHLDSFFKYYISNISTKVNNTLGKIFDVYRKNAIEKKYLNEEKETWDDENNTIKELNNLSAVIMNLSERTYNKMRSSPIDETILRDATTVTKLKVSSVKSTIEEIIDAETKSLQEICNLILQVFFINNAKHTVDKVKSRYFSTYCMSIYKISNSKSPQILRIKEILDIWIKQYGSKYIRLNREATLINFRKAVYIYIVESIIKFS